MSKNAIVVGAGSGISAAVARALSGAGYKVALVARDVAKLADLAQETGAVCFSADASDAAEVASAFDQVDRDLGVPDVVIYNPSLRARGAITDLDPGDVKRSLEVTAFGAFLVGQQAAKRMLARGGGTILFTGASAGIKGFPKSAPFAMGKFAMRGLAQSMARELHPQGVHVAHMVIDGGVRNADRGRPADPAAPDALLVPEAIAESYMHVIGQPRSAWSSEVILRPWVERF